MNENKFWQCPHCGAVNNGSSCRVCHYGTGGQVQSDGGKSNKGLLIGLVVAGAVLIILAAGLVMYLLGRDSFPETESDKVTPVASETMEGSLMEGDLLINKFDDSGIYIRKEPSKNSNHIDKIKKGDQVTILTYLGETVMGDDQYHWYMVETEKGKIGYVREDVVIPVDQ